MEWVKNEKSGGGNNEVEWVIKSSGGGNGVGEKIHEFMKMIDFLIQKFPEILSEK